MDDAQTGDFNSRGNFMRFYQVMLSWAFVPLVCSNLSGQSQPTIWPPGNTTLYLDVGLSGETTLPQPLGSRVTVPPQEHVLMVLPSGVSPIQWTKDGVAIPWATGQTLVLPGVTTADSGKYNIVGTPTMSGAGITLNVAPQGNFANFSALLTLAPGASTQTVGFVIGGISSKAVLVRAVGESLKSFGISNPAGRPSFRFFSSASDGMFAGIAPSSPSGWLPIFASVYAFPLTGIVDGGDSCIVTFLVPGAYTVQVSDTSLQGGAVLFEVYDLPEFPIPSTVAAAPISTTPGPPLK